MGWTLGSGVRSLEDEKADDEFEVVVVDEEVVVVVVFEDEEEGEIMDKGKVE